MLHSASSGSQPREKAMNAICASILELIIKKS
jgi:hypothetical protein